MALSVEKFENLVSHAKVLDGDVVLGNKGQLVKVNHGGWWKSLVCSHVKTSGKSNFGLRRVFYSSLEKEYKAKCGWSNETQSSIEKLLFGKNACNPLSRRTIKQVLNLAQNTSRDDPATNELKMTGRQFGDMIDRGVRIACRDYQRYAAEFNKLGMECKNNFASYLQHNVNWVAD